MSRTKINIRRIRNFAFTQLPKEWVLREVLLAENQEIDVFTFLARLPVWLQLINVKRGAHK
ncbi:MAG: hypothetical protein OEW62_01185 [Candidatus Bathyarchaeota archaeon]|nr:hypothetical protein [Candidatus Bathyarchaeota archaeon]MDH5595219.1 hypothetical protein [Candidatus Bathyarchaeota archaeon]